MQRDSRAWHSDMQQAGKRATLFPVSHDMASYLADDMVRAAVE